MINKENKPSLKRSLLEAIALNMSPKRYELAVSEGVDITALVANSVSQKDGIYIVSFDNHIMLEYAVMQIILMKNQKEVPYTSIHQLFGKEYRRSMRYIFDMERYIGRLKS